MAEVGRSTSQGAAGGGDSATPLSRPNLTSWQGLTSILQEARNAELTPEVYAEFRNIVLEFAQKRGDKKLEAQILATIETFAKPSTLPQVVVQKDAPKVVNAPAPRGVISRRPVPSFLPKKYQSKKQLKATEEAEAAAALSEPTPVPPPEPVPTPLAPAPTPVSEPAPEQTSPPPPPATPVAAPIPVVPYDVGPEEPAPPPPPPPPAPAPAPMTPPPSPVQEKREPFTIKSLEEYRVRVAEIKRTVNALVRNPVALVSHDNALGKTYMAALLNAMKATSPGSPLDPHVAMRELEEAFTAVEDYVAGGGLQGKRDGVMAEPPAAAEMMQSTPAQNEQVAVKESLPPLVDETEKEKSEELPSPVELRAEVKPSTPETVPPSSTEAATVFLESEPDHTPPRALAEEKPVLTAKLNDALERARTASRDIVQQQSATIERRQRGKPKRMDIVEAPDWQPSTAPAIRDQVTERSVTGPSPLELLNDESEISRTTQNTIDENIPIPPALPLVEPPLRSELPFDPNLAPTSELSKIASRQSELVSSEVTEALSQLLHQWKIFASSGLFGLGAGGFEHPLYLKLSRLSMGEVIAGRYENAHPETTRTIKDYVDAWRHEQGVAYNPTETFEHYLRRVILRIIKRQRGESSV